MRKAAAARAEAAARHPAEAAGSPAAAPGDASFRVDFFFNSILSEPWFSSPLTSTGFLIVWFSYSRAWSVRDNANLNVAHIVSSFLRWHDMESILQFKRRNWTHKRRVIVAACFNGVRNECLTCDGAHFIIWNVSNLSPISRLK